jgi:hypothetical protein
MIDYRTRDVPGLDHPDIAIKQAFSGYLCLSVSIRSAEARMCSLPTHEQREAEAKRLKPYYRFLDDYSAVITSAVAKTTDGAIIQLRHLVAERERWPLVATDDVNRRAAA